MTQMWRRFLKSHRSWRDGASTFDENIFGVLNKLWLC